ncbi:MAG: tetratricopeptide repeat protein, partial [Chloroflexi bacterium]|nr:tetratricopeptide repeat protein [Chloroflexota bacterium]
MTDRIRVARASGVGLYDYLAQQVLNQQPPVVRDFLLKTSLLEEFDVELCEAVLGEAPEGTDWFGLIGEVLQNNLFVLPVDNQGTWLRYHHLFRDFLQIQMSTQYPAQVNRILQRLAVVYAERGVWEKAYAISQRIGDRAGIIHLIEQAGTPMLKNGRLNILTKWLDALTLDELTSHPALLSLQGTVEFLFGNVEQGISKLDQAEVAFRNAGDLPQLARVFARRATGHRFMGNYQKAISDTDEALTIASDFDNLQEVQAEAFRVRGLCLHNTGQLAIAIGYLEKALFTYNSIGDISNEALSQLDLGLVHMSAGRFSQALSHYEHALDHWRQSGDITRQANVLNNMGVLHHLQGDYDQAGTFLFEALSLAQKSGDTRIEAYSLASIG